MQQGSEFLAQICKDLKKSGLSAIEASCKGFYTHPVKLFQQKKYQVLKVTEFNDKFDAEGCIWQTCHRILSNKVLPFQTVASKMYAELWHNELQDLKRLEKILISRSILFKKNFCHAWESQITEVKGNICNIHLDT